MIDNKQETTEQPNEPRRGVAPFAGGIEEQGEDSEVSYISYKDFSLGDLGKFFMHLSRPHNEKLKDHTNENDQGFTIDLAGRIQRGNLRDFLRRGCYEVGLQERSHPSDIDEIADQIKIDLWVDNTETIISSDLITEPPMGAAFLIKFDGKNKLEHFVLPKDPEILQAIRISVNSRQENPIDPNSG